MATRLALGRGNTIPTTNRAFGVTWAMRVGETWGGSSTSPATQIAANMVIEQRWFDDRGDTELEMSWISDYVAVPFTLAGTVTFAQRAYESGTSVNIGLRGKLFRIPWDPTEDMAQVTIGSRSGEIGTGTTTDYTWTATPTSTLFKVNDRLLFQGFWYPQGGPVATGVGTLSGSGSNNKYVELTEDVVFSTTPITSGILTPPRLRERGII